MLLDSSSTTTWINKKSLPPGIQGYSVNPVKGTTFAGFFSSSEQVCLQDFMLPKHAPKKSLHKLNMKVFHADCQYNVIIECDVPQDFGIMLDFESQAVVLGGVSKPMYPFPEPVGELLSVDVLLQDFLDSIDPTIHDKMTNLLTMLSPMFSRMVLRIFWKVKTTR